MNEEIPGLDWAGLLMKGINVLYFLWVFFFFFWTRAEIWFGLVFCNVSHTFFLEIWHDQSLFNLPDFLILSQALPHHQVEMHRESAV